MEEAKQKKEISVTTWNINYDHRATETKWKAFDWSSRKASVIDTVLRLRTDIICLQELRKTAVIDLMGDARLGAEYDMAYGRTNATDEAFCLLTMWKRKIWSCSETRTLWFGNDGMSSTWTACPGGNGFGRIVFAATLVPAVSPNPKAMPGASPVPDTVPINVCNVHFGLGESERMHEATLLCNFIDKETFVSKVYNPIVCGDFNSFPDLGGRKEIETFIIPLWWFAQVAPYGSPIPTISGDITMVGTQISYPYDTYVKFKGSDHEEIHPVEGEIGGHLDNIFFSSEFMKLSDHRLLTWKTDGSVADMGDLGYKKEDTTPRFPSDHFPLLATFVMNQ